MSTSRSITDCVQQVFQGSTTDSGATLFPKRLRTVLPAVQQIAPKYWVVVLIV